VTPRREESRGVALAPIVLNRRRMQCIRMLCATVLLVVVVACGNTSTTTVDGGVAPAQGPPPGPPDSQDVFMSTSVTVDADGTIHTKAVFVTRAQEQAENEARTRVERGLPQPLGVVVDASCDSRSVWLYDRIDLSGNRICFTGGSNAEIALGTLTRYVCSGLGCHFDSWELQTGFLWAGAWGGDLYAAAASTPPPGPPVIDATWTANVHFTRGQRQSFDVTPLYVEYIGSLH
jgi:hypothetical protein